MQKPRCCKDLQGNESARMNRGNIRVALSFDRPVTQESTHVKQGSNRIQVFRIKTEFQKGIPNAF